MRSAAQSCTTLLCPPSTVSPPGSSVHGISQARILEWVAISCSRTSRPRDQTHISMFPSLASRFFTTSATWEGGGKGHNSTQDHINFKSFNNKSKPGALPPDERDTFSAGPQTFLSIQRTLRQKSVHFCQAESHGNLESGGKPKDLHLKREKQPMKLRLDRHSPPSAGKPEGERKRGFPAKVLLKELQAVAVSIKDVLFSKEPGTRLSLGRAGLLGNSFLISWESHRPLHSPCASVSSLVKVTFKELMAI